MDPGKIGFVNEINEFYQCRNLSPTPTSSKPCYLDAGARAESFESTLPLKTVIDCG